MFDAGGDENRVDDVGLRRAELKEIFASNKELPHLKPYDFNLIRGIYSRPEMVEVPVGRILISASLGNWGDTDEFDQPSHLKRLWDTYQSIKEIGIVPRISNRHPVRLTEWGGIYELEMGQRRVMTAKLLNIPTIPAEVIRSYPTAMYLPDEQIFKEMEKRKHEGLWGGNLTFSLDEQANYSGGEAQVFSYEGIWVLTRNMEVVKKGYETVGANGKAEEII